MLFNKDHAFASLNVTWDPNLTTIPGDIFTIFTPPQLKVSELTFSLTLSGSGIVKPGSQKRTFTSLSTNCEVWFLSGLVILMTLTEEIE